MKSFTEEAGYVIAKFQSADEYAESHGKGDSVIVERTKSTCKQMLKSLGHTFTDEEFEPIFSEYYAKLNQEFKNIISVPEKMLGHTPHKRIW